MQEVADLRAAQSSALDDALLSASEEDIQKAHQRAVRSAEAILLTDAPLLYPPGQLAVAAVRSGFRATQLQSHKFIEHVAQRAWHAAELSAPDNMHDDTLAPNQRLLSVLSEIDALVAEDVSQHAALEKQAVEVDRKIKLWKKAGTTGGSVSAGGVGPLS